MPGAAVIERCGQGPDLVLLHGWGMHSGVWGSVAKRLAESFTLHLVDLPGHGAAKHQPLDSDLAALAADICAQVPPAAWLGWSMGGLITLQALKNCPERITRAVLVATNPSFVAREHWPAGVSEDLFLEFARRLEHDFEGTLNRFLVLETLGSDTERDSLRRLREQLHRGQMPDVSSLEAGLRILRQSDFTGELAGIAHHCLWLAGGRDRLVPQAAMQRAAERMPHGTFVRIPGAGHAPFIGHGMAFVEHVNQFLLESGQ